jgi:hypothetical protein
VPIMVIGSVVRGVFVFFLPSTTPPDDDAEPIFLVFFFPRSTLQPII